MYSYSHDYYYINTHRLYRSKSPSNKYQHTRQGGNMTLDLSNLSKDLPPPKVLAQEVLAEVAGEFKNAAKRVSALYLAAENKDKLKPEFTEAARLVALLYRKTYQLNEVYTQQGFLTCLDELLEVVSNGGDVENWALTRRAEVIKNTKVLAPSSNTIVSSSSSSSSATVPEPELPKEFGIPEDYSFTFSGPGPRAPGQFRPQMLPLSIQHLKKQRLHSIRKQLRKSSRKSGTESESLDEEVSMKRRRKGE